MVSGRHLQFFCHASEFYALPNDAPLTPNTVTVKHTTDSGSHALGIRPAIDQLLMRDPSWRIMAHYLDSHGLLVLSRADVH